MSVVYKAQHLALNRIVALKIVLHGGHARETDRERFALEAKAIARLNHPNVVQLFEVGEHENHTYLAMEHLECGNLFTWQNRKPIDPRLAAEIVQTLARAIHHAHEQGIVHRDLKPSNILLRRCPETTGPFPFVPKISDFGLAKLLDMPTDLTAPGITCGTPAYMAPEQIRATKGEVGPRADVYGLGTILYELLTCYPAFHGDSAQEIFDLALSVVPTAPRKLRSSVPADLEVICLKCLEKDQASRYPTAAALADDLRRFLAGRPIQARPVSRVERTWRWCRRQPGPAAALAVTSLALCVTTALSFALWKSESRKSEALDQLRMKHDALVEAKDRETAEFHRAEENLRIARDATLATLTELAREPLLQEPKFLEVRKRLLDKAKPTFDWFMMQQSDDPLVLAEQAEVCQMLGLLRVSVGDTKQANVRYHESLKFYTRLVELRPTDPTPILGKADTQLKFAFLLRATGNAADGNQLMDDCLAELVRATARFPTNEDLKVGQIQARIAHLHKLSPPARIRGAGENLRLLQELVTETTRREGATDRTRYWQAKVHQQLAWFTRLTGTPEDTERHYREAVAILEQLVTSGPADLNRRAELAGLQFDYAEFLGQRRQFADARTQAKQSIQRLDALLLESPQAFWFQMLWARCTVTLGVIEEASGDTKAALACYNRAAERWFPLLDQNPEWVMGRNAARELLLHRAALHEQQGNAAQAAADRERFGRICPP